MFFIVWYGWSSDTLDACVSGPGASFKSTSRVLNRYSIRTKLLKNYVILETKIWTFASYPLNTGLFKFLFFN